MILAAERTAILQLDSLYASGKYYAYVKQWIKLYRLSSQDRRARMVEMVKQDHRSGYIRKNTVETV